MNPTVYDFLDMCIEPDLQEVAIYDCAQDKEVFRGTRDNMPQDMQDAEVQSFDLVEKSGPNAGIICINIDSAN